MKSREKTFELDHNPILYFYNMYQNHVYNETMTWGDLYRLYKYYRRFAAWDSKSGSRTMRVYPALLEKD